MLRASLVSVALAGILPFHAHAQEIRLDGFENERFELREVSLGQLAEGANQFSAVLVNKSGEMSFPVIDLRTECNALGLSAWQKQYHFQLDPGETRAIRVEYQIASPQLNRVIVGFGETDGPFDQDAWLALPLAVRAENPPPRPDFLHSVTFARNAGDEPDAAPVPPAFNGEAFLTPARPERIGAVKSLLPDLTRSVREEENQLREGLRALFLSGRNVAPSFDRQNADWGEGSSAAANLERNGMSTELFTILGEDSLRITAFFTTEEGTSAQRKPLILLLGGNPGGTKERLVGAAVYFGHFGYHVVGMERRASARVLDSKEKFLSNFSDPVFDALRLLEYLRRESPYRFSKVGIYGFSAGAGEAKFVAALDDDIDAVVLGCGVTSFEDLFRERAWIPTLSGMVIYPELGLGTPDIGHLSNDEYWIEFEKVQPEHDARARGVFEEIFPYFNDLDPQRVVPLLAPVPLLIVTGAQDSQFRPEGATTVDVATHEAYRALGIPEASEFFIQSRTGHSLSGPGAAAVTAFFERWLK